MAKQSLAMMVFMAMVSEGYAVRVGARTEAQDALLAKIASKVKENENLKPLEKLINGLKNAETLDASQVGMLPAMAERCEVDSADMTAVKTELAKIQMVLDAIESELQEHQRSQSVHGATVVSDPQTTMLREMLLDIKTVVEKGERADQIFEHVTDEATAKSFVVDVLLWEAKDNADLSAQKAKHNVLSAIESELREHPKSQMLLAIKNMVKNGELADQILQQVTDKGSAKTFVAGLLEEASPAFVLPPYAVEGGDLTLTLGVEASVIAVDHGIDSTQTVEAFEGNGSLDSMKTSFSEAQQSVTELKRGLVTSEKEHLAREVQDVYLFSDLYTAQTNDQLTRAEIAAVIAAVTEQRNAAQSEVECLNAQIVALNEQLNQTTNRVDK